ncbi:MAG: lactate racemase domain-containing protein [Anaerolineae bacterium]|nr:lactate racemase domain-containing protein [Thermoflexales bacterium]MDW8407013.1 lactate racemase domain-containing protein [Anaerolineae bacterium]
MDHTPVLSEQQVLEHIEAGLAGLDLRNKRLLVLVPDSTRTFPLPLMLSAIYRAIGRRVRVFNVMIALGTHQPMSEQAVERMTGLSAAQRSQWPNFEVMNHAWYTPGTLVQIGVVPAAEVRAITQGILTEDAPVIINRAVLEHDHILICGPVFPHESVGFSGGNKYLFPGIAGMETISTFHWLSAMLTTMNVIGKQDTPVRALIDRFAQEVPTPVSCIAAVVSGAGVHGVFIGDARTAQRQAAQLSARVHIAYLDKPVHTVIAAVADLYDDLWTAGKGMYKTEPVVQDAGRVVIYAPHIQEISYTHGKWLDQIGYHVRDYFALQMERFAEVPKVVMAHSTNVKGAGSFDLASQTETPRIRVDLASGIPAERCRRVNLGYVDPASVSLEAWERRAMSDDGILVVHHAGEKLYRLREAASA